MTGKWDSEDDIDAGQTHYDPEAERIAREKEKMSKSILGSYQPPFELHVVDLSRADDQSAVWYCDSGEVGVEDADVLKALNAIPALEARVAELEAENARLEETLNDRSQAMLCALRCGEAHDCEACSDTLAHYEEEISKEPTSEQS